MRAFVEFVCRRLSLAVVAIGSVFMLLVFFTVEYTAPQLGEYGINFRGNTNVIDLDTGVKQGDLRSGDRIDLSLLTPQQRFTFEQVRSEERLAVTAIRGDARFPVTLSAEPPGFSTASMLARLIGIPICFFLSLGLASALFLLRPRPATLAFYLYAILMLLKVYQTPLQLAVWPVNLLSYLLLQFVYPGTQIAALLVAQRLCGTPGFVGTWFLRAALAVSVLVFFVWLDPVLWLTFQHARTARTGAAVPRYLRRRAAGDRAVRYGLLGVRCAGAGSPPGHMDRRRHRDRTDSRSHVGLCRHRRRARPRLVVRTPDDRALDRRTPAVVRARGHRRRVLRLPLAASHRLPRRNRPRRALWRYHLGDRSDLRCGRVVRRTDLRIDAGPPFTQAWSSRWRSALP